MEPIQTQTKTSAKDFFLNLGAMVALYTTVVSLLNILFTIIGTSYPQINSYYYGTPSISFPVATLIIFFPIFILLSWLLEKSYRTEPEKRNLNVRKWLTYITLFAAGLVLAGDLVTVLYYFIDGQELTAGFLLKILSVFVVIFMVFLYYISDIRGKLSSISRKIWLAISAVIIIVSIIWGFAVLGSPWTQQLIKYDEQKVSDLETISGYVKSYYETTGHMPQSLHDFNEPNANNISFPVPEDPQTGEYYEYTDTTDTEINKITETFELCATFNKDSKNENRLQVQTYPYINGQSSWQHPAGHYCFMETIPVSQYKNTPTPPPVPLQ